MTDLKGFRGSSSGGTSSAPSAQSNTNNPWAPVTPYLQQGYSEAAKLYAQGPQKYTPFSQVANLTGDQQAYINGTNNYVNSPGTQSLLNTASNTNQRLISGQDNPYAPVTAAAAPMLNGYLSNNNLNDTAQGLNRFMYQNTGDPALQQVMSQSTQQADDAITNINGLIQNGAGFGKNLAVDSGNVARTNNLNQAMGNAFDSQNTQRLQAINLANGINNSRAQTAASMMVDSGNFQNNAQNLGFAHYNTVMKQPLTLLDALNNAGGINQAQAQSQLNDATARWNFNQQSPYNALAQYAAMINPNPAWGNTYQGTQNANTAAGIDNTSQAIGAGTATAGLLAAYNNK